MTFFLWLYSSIKYPGFISIYKNSFIIISIDEIFIKSNKILIEIDNN